MGAMIPRAAPLLQTLSFCIRLISLWPLLPTKMPGLENILRLEWPLHTLTFPSSLPLYYWDPLNVHWWQLSLVACLCLITYQSLVCFLALFPTYHNYHLPTTVTTQLSSITSNGFSQDSRPYPLCHHPCCTDASYEPSPHLGSQSPVHLYSTPDRNVSKGIHLPKQEHHCVHDEWKEESGDKWRIDISFGKANKDRERSTREEKRNQRREGKRCRMDPERFWWERENLMGF